MPKETIRRLAENVARLLTAGAHLAAADPALGEDQVALEGLAAQLGARAPVLGQLAQAVGQARTASGDAAARELVSLASAVTQVRAAQAAAAQPAETSALAPCPPLGTPCNTREIYELRDALVRTGSGREQTLREAIATGAIADLRLADAVVQAIGDTSFGDLIATEAAPLLGAAIAGPLRRRFNPRGGKPDARRLRALVAIEKAGAQDLILRAFEEGQPSVREAALDAIADFLPGRPELEAALLETVAREKSGDARRAAVRALKGYGSDASLEALLRMLDLATTRDAAAEALGASKHPAVVAKLLARLDAALAGKPARKQEQDDDRRERVSALLLALAPHRHPEIARRAMTLLDEYPAATAAVIESGDRAMLVKVADLLAGTDEERFGPAVAAARKLGGAEAFKRLTAVFQARDLTRAAGRARAAAVLGAIEPGDWRWTALLIRVLAGADGAFAVQLVEAIGRLADPSAVKPLVQRLATDRSSLFRAALVRALGALGDPQALDAILAAGASQDYRVAFAVREAVLAINHVSAVDKVRAIVTGLGPGAKPRDRWIIDGLFRELLNRFPGR